MIKSLLYALTSIFTGHAISTSSESPEGESGVLQSLVEVDVVLDNVFSFLLDDDLLNMRLVCKRFLFLVDNCDDSVPALWERLLEALCSDEVL